MRNSSSTSSPHERYTKRWPCRPWMKGPASRPLRISTSNSNTAFGASAATKSMASLPRWIPTWMCEYPPGWSGDGPHVRPGRSVPTIRKRAVTGRSFHRHPRADAWVTAARDRYGCAPYVEEDRQAPHEGSPQEGQPRQQAERRALATARGRCQPYRSSPLAPTTSSMSCTASRSTTRIAGSKTVRLLRRAPGPTRRTLGPARRSTRCRPARACTAA